MEYYAHKIDDAQTQTVKAHLLGTAGKAKAFAVPELADIAEQLGMLHDIGKYAEAFQKKLNGANNGYAHAVCGAIEIMDCAKDPFQKMLACLMAYCIAGHHTGLPDGGNQHDTADGKTLYAGLSRKTEYTGTSDYSAYQKEISLFLPTNTVIQKRIMCSDKNRRSEENIAETIERFAFLTRYLFSCLTDADFLDTEEFYSPEIDRTQNTDFESAARAVAERLSGFHAETQLQKTRSVIQEQAFRAAKNASGISILNMPTGSGKTLCSLKIAMDKITASGGKLKRIVYVIPYTSIIEQTATEFEALFKEKLTVLQHHSNFSFDDIPEADTAKKLKLASENWDVPVVITTSVQFFESLYHYRSSRVRKLHNLADAVIVLDEIHMIPVKQLQPCLRALGYLTQFLHSEVLLLSATMPDYSGLLQKFLPGCPVHELITDKTEFAAFEKCTYHNMGETDYDSVAEKAAAYRSSLIVVNTRAAARNVYRMLSGNKFHLSTYMTPHDRSETIGRIRKALKNGEPVTVVSTSLIEAGVDLDFEAVFREAAGLDNILQSGGRCNREGKRESGDVFVFQTENKMNPDLQQRTAVTVELLEKYPQITSPECIREYYSRLFRFHDKKIEANTIAENALIEPKTGFVSVPFREYADRFEMIAEDTVSVIINNCDETAALLEQLRNGKRAVLRKLQQYSVSLRRFGELDKAGTIIAEYEHTGVLVLTDTSCYSKETGLNLAGFNDAFVE